MRLIDEVRPVRDRQNKHTYARHYSEQQYNDRDWQLLVSSVWIVNRYRIMSNEESDPLLQAMKAEEGGEENASSSIDPEREKALEDFKKKLKDHREWDSKLKELRMGIKGLDKQFEKTEDDIKALQSVGQIIGEVLKQLDEERYIVKASNGPRYIVGCRNTIKKEALKQGVRVALDMTTLTIMRILPREVDPLVYNMTTFEPGELTFGGIGGLNEQIRELREVIELPLKNPELFMRVGIKPPKGVLLYGPPGTGKTLLAKAVAATIGANFIFSPASAIVDKYIGESARLIREMFGYAKEHEPCIIFMDEVDAIGGRRFSEGTSADREIQRTLMELLNQMDGFDYLVKRRLSWPLIDQTPSTLLCSEQEDWTERSKSLYPTRLVV